MIVGSQLESVVQKLLTNVVNQVVNASGICKASQDNIFRNHYETKSHLRKF